VCVCTMYTVPPHCLLHVHKFCLVLNSCQTNYFSHSHLVNWSDCGSISVEDSLCLNACNAHGMTKHLAHYNTAAPLLTTACSSLSCKYSTDTILHCNFVDLQPVHRTVDARRVVVMAA